MVCRKQIQFEPGKKIPSPLNDPRVKTFTLYFRFGQNTSVNMQQSGAFGAIISRLIPSPAVVRDFKVQCTFPHGGHNVANPVCIKKVVRRHGLTIMYHIHYN